MRMKMGGGNNFCQEKKKRKDKEIQSPAYLLTIHISSGSTEVFSFVASIFCWLI